MSRPSHLLRLLAVLAAFGLVGAACVPEGDDPDDVAVDPEAEEPEDPDPEDEPDPDEPDDPEVPELSFMIWTFDTEGVQGYIDQWEEDVDGAYAATLSDTDWGQYHDAMVADFVAGEMPDVLYVSDHWLHEWVAGGWLAPLDEVMAAEDLDPLVDDMFDFVESGMSVDGELHGLPYYADPIGFVYNTRHYEEAGLDEPPADWDEVLEHARTIRDEGVVDYPLGFGWSMDEPFSIEVVTAMLMSRGEEFFDEDLDPTFTEGGSTLHEHIEWVQTAFEEDLVDPDSLQRDGVVDGDAMMAGTQTYGMSRASAMAQWQNPDESPEAGNFELIEIPGETGETLGFVRFYGISEGLVDRDADAHEAAASFLDYFGGPGPDGEYPIIREWVRRHGLGFGYESLFEDDEMRELFGEWVDVDVLEQVATTARARRLSEWYPEWDVFTRGELQSAYLGDLTAEEAAESIADRWNELREDQ